MKERKGKGERRSRKKNINLVYWWEILSKEHANMDKGHIAR